MTAFSSSSQKLARDRAHYHPHTRPPSHVLLTGTRLATVSVHTRTSDRSFLPFLSNTFLFTVRKGSDLCMLILQLAIFLRFILLIVRGFLLWFIEIVCVDSHSTCKWSFSPCFHFFFLPVSMPHISFSCLICIGFYFLNGITNSVNTGNLCLCPDCL